MVRNVKLKLKRYVIQYQRSDSKVVKLLSR